MSGAVFREGERVTLRTIEEGDLEFVHAGVNHPAVRTFVGQSFPTSLARERRYFEEASETLDTIGVLVWADDGRTDDDRIDDGRIDDDRTDDRRVGVVEFDPIDRETGVAELGLWIHPAHQGQGYATEAVSLFLDYAFDELRMHKVTANAYDTNGASRRLFERLGFAEEGIGREDAFFDGDYHDTHYFGLLESEWRDGE